MCVDGPGPGARPACLRALVRLSAPQCVAAALRGPCLRAVTRLVAAHAGLSLMALIVTTAALATMAILTAAVSGGLGRGWVSQEGHPQVPMA